MESQQKLTAESICQMFHESVHDGSSENDEFEPDDDEQYNLENGRICFYFENNPVQFELYDDNTICAKYVNDVKVDFSLSDITFLKYQGYRIKNQET